MDRMGHLPIAAISGVFGLLRRSMRAAVQYACGLRGHDTLIHFRHRRMTLHCQRCGHESPGWTIATPSQTAAEAERERHRAIVTSHRVA